MDELLDIINNSHRGMDFGVVNVTIKKYGGKIATVDSDKHVTYKTDKGNIEGLALISTILKKTSEAVKLAPDVPSPPTVSFVVFYDRKGEIRQVNVSDSNRVNLKKE